MVGREELPDPEVVQRVLAGETDLFGVLVERYRAEFGRYAAALVGDPDLAADAMQEAFIRAYDALATCRDPRRVKAWFFRILTNQCHNLRQRAPRHEVSLASADPPSSDTADAEMRRKELAEVLAAALGRLTQEQREAFVLKHVEGRSYAEMAALLDVGIDALKMRVHRARDSLRAQLEDTL